MFSLKKRDKDRCSSVGKVAEWRPGGHGLNPYIWQWHLEWNKRCLWSNREWEIWVSNPRCSVSRERKRDLTCFSTTRRERERISVFHNRHRQTDRKSVCAWVKIAHIPSPSLSKRLKASLNSEIWSVESWSAMSTPTQIFSEFVQKRREGEEEMSVCM